LIGTYRFTVAYQTTLYNYIENEKKKSVKVPQLLQKSSNQNGDII